MAIKIDPLYGNESTWLNVKGYGKLATLTQQYSAKPYFNHTLGAGLAAGNLDEVNKSVCPIAVDSGSLLANGDYVMLNVDGTLYDYKVEPSAQTALMYTSSFRGYSANTYYNQYVETRDTQQNSFWNSGATTSDYVTDFPAVATSMTQPIVEFPYKNYVLMIIVFASATTEAPYYETRTIRCDLKTYVEHYATTYPYVNCVEVTPMRWTTEYQYPDWQFSNVSVGSDNSNINSTSNQKYFNFSTIGIGNVNNFVDKEGKKYTYYTSNNHTFGSGNLGWWDGDELRTVSIDGPKQTIFGYDESWADEMYQNYYRVLYIPNINGLMQIKQRETSRPDRIYTYYHVDDVDWFKEFCLKQVAYFGMFFSISYMDMNSADINNFMDFDTTYMGVIDDQGVTHGDYLQGKAIKDHPQSKWDSLKNQSPYDYEKEVDPTIYDEETKLSNISHAGNAFINLYSVTYATIQNIKNYLYGTVTTETNQDKLLQEFLTVNPIDCITSCIEFPFSTAPDRAPSTNIIIGNTIASGGEATPITGRAITDTIILLDFGEIRYFPVNKNFLDYEPYSTAELYIPYVGFIPISPSEFMNKIIKVVLICDLMTGSCEALIYKDGLVVETANGNVGSQVPITGIQQADYANGVHAASTRLAQANNATLTSIATTIGAVASGNPVAGITAALGMTSNIFSQEQAQYDLDHVMVPFKQTGTASPNLNFANEQRARLIMKRPVLDTSYNPVIYGRTTGFACAMQGLIGSFTGFSVFSGADLSGISAPDIEKSQIFELLSQGIIIN